MTQRSLTELRINRSGIDLTEDDIQPDMPDIDIGFIKARCTRCGAHLFWSDGMVLCLNACHLSDDARARMRESFAKHQQRLEQSAERYNKRHS